MPGIFRRRMKNWSFKRQQFVMYGITLGIILLFSFGVIFWALWVSIRERTETILDSSSVKISASFDNLIDTINQLSKMIMFDSDMQEMLADSSGNSTIQGTSPLHTIIGSTDVSSVYLYDFYGYEYALMTILSGAPKPQKNLNRLPGIVRL